MLRERGFWKDCFFGTLWIFGTYWLILNISQLAIFDVFDPIGDAVEDMELSDVSFSRLKEHPPQDTNIVLINIGPLGRRGIARQIEILNKHEPAVVGFDIFLPDLKEDKEGDEYMAEVLANTKQLVMANKVIKSRALEEQDPDGEVYDSLHQSHEIFRVNAVEAFANLDTEAGIQEDYKTCRAFPPFILVKDELAYALGLKMAWLYDSVKAQKVFKRDRNREIIYFKGNAMDNRGGPHVPKVFPVIDYEDVLKENFDPGLVRGKIVMIGYLGDDLSGYYTEDNFFSPLNEILAGKAALDMYGAVIHANIIAMILEENYINSLDENIEMAFAIVFCFFINIIFGILFKGVPRWYDGISKAIQVFLGLFFLFFTIYIFHWFDFKMDLTHTLWVVGLSGDTLEGYYGLGRNLFSKEGRRRILRPHADLTD